MSHPTTTLMVFARAPVPGQAKTRLIPALGEEGAARLQQRLLEQTLGLGESLGRCRMALWCSPDTDHPTFRRLASAHDLVLKRQQGGDLGERMANAFEQTLRHNRYAIIIGTDCPDLRADDIQQCIEHLDQGVEAVVGPAADGGYYLLALRRFEPSLFHAVSWGSDQVLAQTIRRLEAAGMRYRQLEIKHDLDRPADLQRFHELY